MNVKLTMQGLFIYATIWAYLCALLLYIFQRRKAGRVLFAAGFVIALASVIWRCVSVRHIPLQNLFEVFVFLGMPAYPVSVFCRKFLKINSEIPDVIIGIVVLFPAGFVFSQTPAQLPPALQSLLFGPHVLSYMLAYIILTKAAVEAAKGLAAKEQNNSLIFAENARLLVNLGFPLLTLGLLLGSVWARQAWGRWWGWDPKELWSLATWLVYVSYYHWKYFFSSASKKNENAMVIWGFCFIVITLLMVNLARIFSGLHSYAV